jgi:hypothetical protein
MITCPNPAAHTTSGATKRPNFMKNGSKEELRFKRRHFRPNAVSRYGPRSPHRRLAFSKENFLGFFRRFRYDTPESSSIGRRPLALAAKCHS